MFPTQTQGMGMRTLSAIRVHYAALIPLWNSFVEQAGGPGEDLKHLAALPPAVVAAALAQARNPMDQHLRLCKHLKWDWSSAWQGESCTPKQEETGMRGRR